MFGITLAEYWFVKTALCVVILRFAPQKIAEVLVWINNQVSDIKIEFDRK